MNITKVLMDFYPDHQRGIDSFMFICHDGDDMILPDDVFFQIKKNVIGRLNFKHKIKENPSRLNRRRCLWFDQAPVKKSCVNNH